MSITLRLIVGFVLVAAAHGSSSFDGLDFSETDLNDLRSNLPNTNFSMEDAKKLVRDKCVLAAGEERGAEAYGEIETGAMELGECVMSIVNYTAIQEEINGASPNGDLDEVFNKYCKKRPEAVECINKFNAKLVPCLDQDEQDNQKVFMRIINSLLNFVCHKGGDQIALFIAEKGPECLESKSSDIQKCINTTFSGYVPKEGLDSITTLPKLVMGEKQCGELQRLETCIVEKLETCSEITPANIVESMFRFIKNETICRTTSSYTGKLEGAKSAGFALGALNASVYSILIALYFFVAKQLRA